MSQETRNKAMDLINVAKDNRRITGRRPIGVAAATLYLASTLTSGQVTQHRVARVSDVTEVTIINISQTLKQGLNYVY